MYIHVKGTITVPITRTAAPPINRNEKVAFKNCATTFINYIGEINNTQVNDAHDIAAVISMYNTTEYSDTY